MARKFIDSSGLLYLWSKIVGKFVAKDEIVNNTLHKTLERNEP